MKFINENDKLAFEYKSEKIYLDDFLDFVKDKKTFSIKTKDGIFISFCFCNRKEDEELSINRCLDDFLCNELHNGKTHLPNSILLSNYIEQIIKLLKADLKDGYSKDIYYAATEDDANKFLNEFKEKMDILNSELKRAEQVKKESSKLDNLKQTKITEIENLM